VNDLLMQFQADVLGTAVVRPRVAETTALGAAYAAGLATGLWPDLEALAALWASDRRWEPAMPEADRAGRYAAWNAAVARSLDWGA
jgi:glycerol kinase